MMMVMADGGEDDDDGCDVGDYVDDNNHDNEN